MNARKPTSDRRQSYLDHVTAGSQTGIVSSIDSLSAALKVGFRVLKILMVVLAIVFLFSNIFWVPEGYVAVQSRFGQIVGRDGASLRPPGGPYPAFPYPLDEIIRIPTTIQKISLFKAFWSEEDVMEPTIDDRPETEGLRPGVHGSLMTADKNIVQGVWVVHYKLDYSGRNTDAGSAVTDFIRNVGSMERAAEIIRRIAQAAIVRVISQTNVADFVAGRIDTHEIRRIIATRLTQLKTGLRVTGVSTSKYAAPKSLVPDFEAVTQAESQKALAIEKASRHRVSTLNELAGSGWQELLEVIDDYERALQNTDKTAEQATFATAEQLFLAGETGGFIKQVLDEARSEKTAAIQRARASATRFAELLPSYEENPGVLQSQLVQDTVKEIWSDISVESLYIPKGQKLFLDIGPQDLLME